MRECPQCGARYAGEAGFCPMDGARLVDVREAPIDAPHGSTVAEALAREVDPSAGEGAARKPQAGEGSGLLRWQPARTVATDPVRVGPDVPGVALASQSGSAWASATAAARSPVEEPGWSPPRWQPVELVLPPPSEPDRAAPEPTEPEEDLLGRVLGDRYRIDERIGAGGMGLVYRATHVLIGKRVAVKLLKRRFAQQADVAERFMQEARVASSIKHPNVVDISDYGTTPDGSPYYVMEYLDGHSLAREIERAGKLDPGRALDIVVQVARGLAAAHQGGIIHRDLKPENVFLIPVDELGREGGATREQAKILDFGIARVIGRKTRLTAAGSVVGTPEYMSPEQSRGDEVDTRTDLYALGVILFEALTGQVPLRADSLVGTLTKQVFEVPPRLREIDPRLDRLPSIEAAIVRLLAKNRDERPGDALTAARLLQTAAANDLVGPDPEHRARAAVDGFHAGDGSRAREPAGDVPRGRRSTIMLGSGAVSSAHSAEESDGPATGSFAARTKNAPESVDTKRPSVIIREGTPMSVRPARMLPAEGPPAASASVRAPVPQSVVPRTPTPEPEPSEALQRRKRRHDRRRHLPLLLFALGAAIFAALVTIGFVRWLERRSTQVDPDSREGVKDGGEKPRSAAEAPRGADEAGP